MIEPVGSYKRLKEFDGKIYADVTPPMGIDFLKVMLFKKRNGLERLKVNEDTGEVLNDQSQIEAILNSCNRNDFYEATKLIRVVKE